MTDLFLLIENKSDFCGGVKSLMLDKSYTKDLTDIFQNKYNIFIIFVAIRNLEGKF